MRVLFLSNGHGEDQIGSRLALELQAAAPGFRPEAFPLVGDGAAYRRAGFPVRGPARTLPSGGLTMHSPGNLVADLRAGLLSDLNGQLRALRLLEADAVVVVGDIWALSLSLLLRLPARRRFVVQTLVSELLNDGRLALPTRLFMERISLPERWLLQRHTAAVWLRDAETATELRRRGVSQARYAGSLLFAAQPPVSRQDQPLVLLLPGSRAWASRSLGLLLPLAAELPGLRFAVSWAPASAPQLPPGWRFSGEGHSLVNGAVQVEFAGEFSGLLARASVVVGTAGTAMEQAVASGLPALSFVIPGKHTAAFLRNQQRLLAGALVVAPAHDVAVLKPLLNRLLTDEALRSAAREAGRRVLGRPGGLAQIARQLQQELSSVS